jgi:uncharacterized membrane protein
MTDEHVFDPDVTSDDKTWALLSYLFTPLIPIILLLLEDKKNRPFLKAHYPQALVWGIFWAIISIILSVTVILAPIACVTGIVMLVFNILWGIKAYKGEYVNIPVITEWVKKQGWAG